MVEIEFRQTYPYRIRCRPPAGDALNKRNAMEEWLNANVKWDGILGTGMWGNTAETLFFEFHVASIEDAGIVKMRC